MNNAEVKLWILKNYDGGDIVLNKEKDIEAIRMNQ